MLNLDVKKVVNIEDHCQTRFVSNVCTNFQVSEKAKMQQIAINRLLTGRLAGSPIQVVNGVLMINQSPETAVLVRA